MMRCRSNFVCHASRFVWRKQSSTGGGWCHKKRRIKFDVRQIEPDLLLIEPQLPRIEHHEELV
ncbi:hypothetical protein [Candidatus Electronema sp. TJ]|uniref:hypothetical protein n=1 Tax=Candidatus Electronema sp. TJ TaxID=3401573 RepID=UPI003AA95E44